MSYSQYVGKPTEKKSGKSVEKKKSSSGGGFLDSLANKTAIKIVMNEKGQIVFRDGADNEITDAALIRKIKATPQFKAQKEALEQERLNRIDGIVNEAYEENEQFINIYKMAPNVDQLADFIKALDDLKPEVFSKSIYAVPMPTEQSVRAELEVEAKNVVQKILFGGKQRAQYVEDHLQERLTQNFEKWNNDKLEFDCRQDEEQKAAELKYNEEYEKEKKYLTMLIDGDGEIVSEAFDDWISTCELPVEIDINYDWNQSEKVMMIDVDLPEVEDIPATMVSKTSAGNLKEKKKPQNQLRDEYARLIFGLAVLITGSAFNISPAIEKVLISGYTQRRNTSGDLVDEYVFSIKIPREVCEQKMLSEEDPMEFCMSFENRCNLTSTKLLKAITPFDAY